MLPHYHPFGFFTFTSLPDHATIADLRRAGVALPQDAVTRRRHIAAGFLGGADAAGLLGAGLLLLVRRHRPPR